MMFLMDCVMVLCTIILLTLLIAAYGCIIVLAFTFIRKALKK